MDIFNRKKVAELERKIERQERDLENYRRKEEERNSKKHRTGVWCEGCKNLCFNTAIGCFGYPYRFCMLDNECPDRKA